LRRKKNTAQKSKNQFEKRRFEKRKFQTLTNIVFQETLLVCHIFITTTKLVGSPILIKNDANIGLHF
jgi:hypothetical protein